MLEDAITKDVFREMDGFLALIGTLSTLPLPLHLQDQPGPVREPVEQVQRDAVEGMRLALAIIAQTLHDHNINARYFKSRVGYESLAQAIRPLVQDEQTVDQTLDTLLLLSLRDFNAASGYFASLRTLPLTTYDLRAAEYAASVGTLRDADALSVLWSVASEVGKNNGALRYGLYKLFERLAAQNHRGQVMISGLGLVGPIFDSFYEQKLQGTLEDRERSVMQKLLRRILEVGVTTTAEARIIFQRSIKHSDDSSVLPTLDADVIEILRAAMKAKWPAHFSLENNAALTLTTEENIKGLPTTGFTFMVSRILSSISTLLSILS
jgi:hypothetical protein